MNKDARQCFAAMLSDLTKRKKPDAGYNRLSLNISVCSENNAGAIYHEDWEFSRKEGLALLSELVKQYPLHPSRKKRRG